MNVRGVSVARNAAARYPEVTPFDPAVAYPEFPRAIVSSSRNDVYDLMRRTLWDLDLDAAHRGTAAWNPLGDIIRAGATVVIKPNFALDHNTRVNTASGLSAVITHGAVIRAVTDYVWKACGPSGRVVVCDTPLQTHADIFANAAEASGTTAVVTALRERGVNVELRDLRDRARQPLSGGHWQVTDLTGDPLGYADFDLKESSAFATCSHQHRLETNEWERLRHHRKGQHRYSVSRTVLRADAVVSIPKLKTHRKAGITVSIKNLFGVTHRKYRVPHWRRGIDDAPSRRTVVSEILKTAMAHRRSRPAAAFLAQRLCPGGLDGRGDWIGNDTLWRGLVDIARIVIFGDADGAMHATPQRAIFTVVDGITAGEGYGPLGPDPRPFAAIISGRDPVGVDLVASRLMGIDPRAIRYLVALTSGAYSFPTSHQIGDFDDSDALDAISEQFVLPSRWEGARA